MTKIGSRPPQVPHESEAVLDRKTRKYLRAQVKNNLLVRKVFFLITSHRILWVALHAKYSPKKTNPSMQHAWKTEVKKKVKSWSSRLRDKEDTLLNKAIYTNPKFVTKQDARSLYSCFRVSLLQSQYFISSWLHTIFFTHFCDALNLRAENSQSLSS